MASTIFKTWEVTSADPRPSHEAQDGERVPYDQPFPNGQYYPGDPRVGAEESANCRCIMGIEGEVPETPEFTSIEDATNYIRTRYGFSDLTGLKDKDLDAVQQIVAQVDRLVQQYPQLRENPDWRLSGIGTYDSPSCPPVVRELGSDAWAVTRNGVEIEGRPGNGPFIWLNPAALGEGTGLMGEIGFTAEKTAEDAIIHEMGHAVAATSDVTQVERMFIATRDEIYAALANPERGFMSDTGSIYAGGSRWEEAFATVFFRLNSPHGLEGLSKAAIRRLRALAAALNERIGLEVL